MHALENAEERDEDMAWATSAATAAAAVGGPAETVAAAAAAAAATAVASASQNMFDVLADNADDGCGSLQGRAACATRAAAPAAPSFVLQAASFSLLPPPPLADLDEATGEAGGAAGAGEVADDREEDPDL